MTHCIRPINNPFPRAAPLGSGGNWKTQKCGNGNGNGKGHPKWKSIFLIGLLTTRRSYSWVARPHESLATWLTRSSCPSTTDWCIRSLYVQLPTRLVKTVFAYILIWKGQAAALRFTGPSIQLQKYVNSMRRQWNSTAIKCMCKGWNQALSPLLQAWEWG